MTNYQFLQIILKEVEYKRTDVVDFSSPEFKTEVNVNTENVDNEENQSLNVTMELNFTAGAPDTPSIKAKIVMIGFFKYGNDKQELSIETFAKVNAPAIMFPFIREQFASLTMKSGLNPILLPPINFTKQKP
jgi:preprotein translocase subunit SecB